MSLQLNNLRPDSGAGHTLETITAALDAAQREIVQAIRGAEQRAPGLRVQAEDIIKAIGSGPAVGFIRAALSDFDGVRRSVAPLATRALAVGDVAPAQQAIRQLVASEQRLAEAINQWSHDAQLARSISAMAAQNEVMAGPQPAPPAQPLTDKERIAKLEQQVAALLARRS